ncbi:MAG: ATP-binding protein [Pseudomonadota bacterium]
MPAAPAPLPATPAERIFAGDSAMAQRMRAHDWAATPLGPPALWSEALATALRILLTSRFEMWLGWGPDIRYFYNDAYVPTLGRKHPWALGQPMREVWSEVWEQVQDRVRTVYERGEATWDQALLLLLERDGYAEETYHTFSYSPILEADGRVGGLFCTVTEETHRVISERRLSSLRQLAAGLAGAAAREDVLVAACAALQDANRDLPFALLYLFDDEGRAQLVCTAGIAEGHRLAPLVLDAAHPMPSAPPASSPPGPPWDARGLAPGEPVRVVALAPAADLPTGPWAQAPTQALVVSLGGGEGERALGFLVAAVCPHQRLSVDYESFVGLLAGQVTAALSRVALAQQDAAERDRLRALFTQAPSFMCVLRGPRHVYELVNESYLGLVGRRGVEGLPIREVLPELEGQGFFELLDEVLRSGVPYRGSAVRVALRTAAGGPPVERFLDFIYQPIVGAKGRIDGVFVDGYDVTEKMQAQETLRQLNSGLEARVAERTRDLAAAMGRLQAESAERAAAEEALRQAQKMEAVGQLTGGIAHDFNNLLQGITGSLDVLKLRLKLGRTENVERLLDGAMASAQRAAGLTHRLLAFSRRQPLDPKPVDANRLVGGMEDLLRRTMGERVHMQLALADGLWTTLCDGNQLENALLNLCINARDAMPDEGMLTIATSNESLAPGDARLAGDTASGDYVCIAIGDTGVGMPPDVLGKVFEPFYTTKPLGRGTGLGLSMIYGFARQSRGQIRLDSAVGEGTTACIYLPRHDGAAAPADRLPQLGEEHRSDTRETLLVVEDEPVVRGLVVDLLRGLGYRVLEAGDGAAALLILESDVGIDLLVTDIGLPVVNGRQVFDAARIARPDLRALFMTGYAEGAAMEGELLRQGVELITKPFPLERLASQVARMLGRLSPTMEAEG